MKICRKIQIKGRVQGVGFRFYTRRWAQKLGLKGFVENKLSGMVYLEIEGKEKKINLLITKLKQGPPLAKVEEIKIIPCELQNFSSFEIKR